MAAGGSPGEFAGAGWFEANANRIEREDQMNIVPEISKHHGSGCYLNLDHVVEFRPEKAPDGKIEYSCYGVDGICIGTIAKKELLDALPGPE
jgi:hypothetical protein